MKKEAYEWVINMNDGQEFILTEGQYAYYKENFLEGRIFFDTFEINPSFVSSAFRRLASEGLKKKYPCKTCQTNGYLNEKEKNGALKVCPNCQGTGMNKE